MSLEDKFMPSDGSFINEFDNFMIRKAAKVADFYQEKTGKSYKDLTRNLHNAGTCTAVVSAATLQLTAISALGACYICRRGCTFESSLQEQVDSLNIDFNKHEARYYRLALSSVSALVLAGGAISFMIQGTIMNPGVMGHLGAGSALALSAAADYLSKSDIPDVKEKLF
jgi:hypothetical protein